MHFHQYAVIPLALASSLINSATPVAAAAVYTYDPHNDPLKISSLSPCIQTCFNKLWREAGPGHGYEAANDVQAWCDRSAPHDAHYWFVKKMNMLMEDICGKEPHWDYRQAELIQWGYRTCGREWGFTEPEWWKQDR